nr:MAG TPA: hypothetical protein [Caudoviricetes sp.]
MTGYQAQAKQFLADCKATMEINFVGREIPSHWLGETKPHNKYQFTITTPKGKYTSYFWDSLRNTEVSEVSERTYAQQKYKASYDCLRSHEKAKARAELTKLKANAIPTEYDILACVEKYSYDSFSDFCSEFGYSTDSISARKTFLACGEEYAGLCRIFTEEQMEKMREIN